MSESSDGKRMTGAINWKAEVTWACGPLAPGDTRESWLARGARRSRVTFRQIKSLFYEETTDPKFSVAESVRSAAAQARREAAELATRFESIAGGLNATDPDFHREDVAALIQSARTLRGLDRAGDS